EGAPAQPRLRPEEQDRVALASRRPRMLEGVLRPVDAPHRPLDERDVRPRRLEVEELLRVDRGELLRVPGTAEEAVRHRRALPAVVPAAKRGDHDGTRQLWTAFELEVVHQAILDARGRQSRATNIVVAAQSAAASVTCARTSHHGSFVRYWISPTAICAASTQMTSSAARSWRTRCSATQASSSTNEMP